MDADKNSERANIYRLMEFQQTTLSNLHYIEITGRRVLNRILLTHLRPVVKNPNIRLDYDEYLKFEKQFSSHYIHYINILQVTFSSIENSSILTKDEKTKFIEIFRAQLSSIELSLWAYNFYFKEYDENIETSLQKHKIFANINHADLGNHEHYQIFNGSPLENI